MIAAATTAPAHSHLKFHHVGPASPAFCTLARILFSSPGLGSAEEYVDSSESSISSRCLSLSWSVISFCLQQDCQFLFELLARPEETFPPPGLQHHGVCAESNRRSGRPSGRGPPPGFQLSAPQLPWPSRVSERFLPISPAPPFCLP